MTKERLQANFRIEPADQSKINDLRKWIETPSGKVPTESYVWREALTQLHRNVYMSKMVASKGRKDRK